MFGQGLPGLHFYDLMTTNYTQFLLLSIEITHNTRLRLYKFETRSCFYISVFLDTIFYIISQVGIFKYYIAEVIKFNFTLCFLYSTIVNLKFSKAQK